MPIEISEYKLPITVLAVLVFLLIAVWLRYFRRERFYDFCEKVHAEVNDRVKLDRANGVYEDNRWKYNALKKLINSDEEAAIKFWRTFESFIPDRLWHYLYGSIN